MRRGSTAGRKNESITDVWFGQKIAPPRSGTCSRPSTVMSDRATAVWHVLQALDGYVPQTVEDRHDDPPGERVEPPDLHVDLLSPVRSRGCGHDASLAAESAPCSAPPAAPGLELEAEELCAIGIASCRGRV